MLYFYLFIQVEKIKFTQNKYDYSYRNFELFLLISCNFFLQDFLVFVFMCI